MWDLLNSGFVLRMCLSCPQDMPDLSSGYACCKDSSLQQVSPGYLAPKTEEACTEDNLVPCTVDKLCTEPVRDDPHDVPVLVLAQS